MIKLTKEMQETKEKVNELCDKMARAQKAYEYFDDNKRYGLRTSVAMMLSRYIKKAADLAEFCNRNKEYDFHIVAVNKLIKFAEDSPYNDYISRLQSMRTLYWWKSVLLDNYMAKQCGIIEMPSDFDEVELEND